MKDTSKPAFPAMDMNQREGIDRMELRFEGMTLLEYYVAHAPVEVQIWFNPTMEKQPKVLIPPFNKFGKDSDHKYSDLYRSFYNDECDQWEHNPETQPVPQEFKDEVEEYTKKWNESHAAAQAWGKEHNKQVYVQWPLAWAREQIRQLEENNIPQPIRKGELGKIGNQVHLAILEGKAPTNQIAKDIVEIFNSTIPQTDIKTFSDLVQKILKEDIIIKIEVVNGEPRLYSNLEGKYFDVGGYVKAFPESAQLHRID